MTQSRRVWTITKGSNVSSPIFHEGHLYFLHENNGIAYCVEAATGKLVFEERLAGAGQFYASPILADVKLYAVGRRGTVFVLADADPSDLRTAHCRFRCHSRARSRPGPSASGGHAGGRLSFAAVQPVRRPQYRREHRLLR